MRTAHLLLRGCLTDFVSPDRRRREFDVHFELPVGLRDLVQSCGVPHVEVGGVVVDGAAGGFDRVVDGGARIEAFPRYPLVAPPPRPCFLLDAHLGRLARYLRLCGFDTAHDEDLDDENLARRSVAEDRILLTRDRGLLMRAELTRAAYVRGTDPRRQLTEVLGRFALAGRVTALVRCLVCNGVLDSVDPAQVREVVPEPVWERHQRFTRCRDCRRVYWSGSHHTRLQAIVAGALAEVRDGRDS